MTDDGLVYQALSVHFCRAKLITHFDGQICCDSQLLWRNIPSPEFGAKLEVRLLLKVR